MKHIDEKAFADFVRGKLNSGEHAVVEGHLAHCSECRDAMELWRKVFESARQEQTFQPPEDAVRVAKAFAANALKRRGEKTLKLTFDSLLAVAPTGIRGASDARQMLFTCDQVSIDLRMEPSLDSKRMIMIGQIMHRATNQGVMGATVSLLSSNKVLVETWSNEYGEFQLECPIGEELSLRIGGADGYRMELPKAPN